jgi:hypothetical protein
VTATVVLVVAGATIASGVSAATITPPPAVPAAKIPDFSIHMPRLRAAHLRAGGKTVNYAITLGSIAGYTGNVTLSVSGLPTGTSGAFTVNPAPISTAKPATPTSSFNLTVASTATPGTYPFTITGTSGSLTHTFNTAIEILP